MIFILEVWIATQFPKDTVIKPEPSFRHLPELASSELSDFRSP